MQLTLTSKPGINRLIHALKLITYNISGRHMYGNSLEVSKTLDIGNKCQMMALQSTISVCHNMKVGNVAFSICMYIIMKFKNVQG